MWRAVVSRLETVSITDNDTGLAFEFANYWVRENEGSVLIGVVRGDDGDFPVTVNVSTVDSTAQAGVDYAGVTNTIAFAAGEKVKLFTVPVINDGNREPNKTFRSCRNPRTRDLKLSAKPRFTCTQRTQNTQSVPQLRTL